VGNIPYYITGAIFRKSFEQKVLPEQMIFLIQKEVAERIVARDKKESLLSVSIRIFSNQVKIV
jgi:16S rRNA (adenine1518-N6/adenine1519-N6)-dimethyltransferase